MRDKKRGTEYICVYDVCVCILNIALLKLDIEKLVCCWKQNFYEILNVFGDGVKER